MQLLDDKHAECFAGGGRNSFAGSRRPPLSHLVRSLRGLGVGGAMPLPGNLSGSSTVIDTTITQINLAFNVVLNGGSIVNNQLNGLDFSVAA